MAVQVSQASIVAHHTGALSASVSSIALLAHTAALGNVQVSNIGMVVHHTDEHKPVQVSASSLVVHHTDEHKPVPVSSVALVVHRSLGLYMKMASCDVEEEVDITGVRFKPLRGEMMRQAYFIVQLSHAYDSVVSVNYTTVPGTALPPAEYNTRSGTLVFQIGETSKIIVVPVREEDTDIETNFTVLLTNPINVTIVDGEGLAEI